MAETEESAAFTAALSDHLKANEVSYRRLAELLADEGISVSKDTVSLWVNGKQPMRPREVFAVERALELRAGALSRLLGYLPVEAKPIKTPEEAVEADASLGDINRRLVLAAIRFARESQ